MRYVLCDMQTGTQDIRLPVTAVCPVCGHDNDLAETRHGQSIFTYVCGKQSLTKQRDGSCGSEFDVLGTMPDLPSAKLTSPRFETGRAFCTKLWNSARFAFMNLEEAPATGVTRDELALEDRWLLDRLNGAIAGVHRGLQAYNPSAALGAAREFFWGDLCDWYLEVIKGRLAAGGRSAAVARAVLAFGLDQVLRLLHPFVPFVSEHLWQRLGEQVPARGLGELADAPADPLLITATWPAEREALADDDARALFEQLQVVTRAIREFRATQNFPMRQELEITLVPPPARVDALAPHAGVVARLVNLSALHVDAAAARPAGSVAKVVGDLQLFVHDALDVEAEKARLDKELARVDDEIATCDKKLGNSKFVERAPEHVVQQQRDRRAGFVAQRDAIVDALEALG